MAGTCPRCGEASVGWVNHNKVEEWDEDYREELVHNYCENCDYGICEDC